MTSTEKSAIVRQLVPLLAVSDVQRSVEFYRDRLGFTLTGQAENEGKLFWCSMARDGSAIMLQEAKDEDGPAKERGRGVSFYFVCEDADAVYAELTSRGLQIGAPTVASYGMKQVAVPEPDGYYLCFESPAAAVKS
jgi:uncharacterized glyoxalase superfamily protein PhnB